MDKWIEIYNTKSLLKARMIENHLKNNDIPTIVIDRQDSSYNAFGLIHLRVPSKKGMLAHQLIGNMTN